MIVQTIYGLFDPEFPDVLRYIGRTDCLETRHRFHQFKAIAQDVSPKGLWVTYLWYAHREPLIVPIEQQTFDPSNKTAATVWAKDRERYWIEQYKADKQILNNETFWSTRRDAVPPPIRKCWESLHSSLMFGDFVANDLQQTLQMVEQTTNFAGIRKPEKNGEKCCLRTRSSDHREYHERARRAQLEAIESLAEQFADVTVAPIESIRTMRWDYADFEDCQPLFID